MQDEGNEDDCDEEYANGLSVEALAQAAAALRRQSSGGSTGSNGELKLNWKQVRFSCIQLVCYFNLFRDWMNALKCQCRTYFEMRLWYSVLNLRLGFFLVITSFLFKDCNGRGWKTDK